MPVLPPREHHYDVHVDWTGNRGTGTSGYRAYGRESVVRAAGPPPIAASSDRAFRGDPSRWNPEQLLVAAAAQCHLLAYLHHAADAGVVVVGYADDAHGVMVEDADGGGRFTAIELHPVVTVAERGMAAAADGLHALANRDCFIAQSLAVPVTHRAETRVAGQDDPGSGQQVS